MELIKAALIVKVSPDHTAQPHAHAMSRKKQHLRAEKEGDLD